MLKITIETDGRTDVVDCSAEEEKAFSYIAVDPAEWLLNMIRTRLRAAVNTVVKDASDKRPEKLTEAARLSIVGTANIESAKVREEKTRAMTRGVG